MVSPALPLQPQILHGKGEDHGQPQCEENLSPRRGDGRTDRAQFPGACGAGAHAAVVRQSSLIRKLTQELTGTNITSASVDPPDRDCRTSGFSRIAAEC